MKCGERRDGIQDISEGFGSRDLVPPLRLRVRRLIVVNERYRPDCSN